MKILIAGAYDNVPHTTVRFMEKAFGALSHDVGIFDFRRIREERGNEQMQVDLLSEVREKEPGAVIVMKGDLISPRTLEAIRKHAHVSLRYMDSPFPKWLKKLAAAADSTFITAGGLIPQFEKAGAENVFHLWEGVDPEIHRHWDTGAEEFSCDVAFVGVNKTGRDVMLRAIARAGADVTIYGRKWPSDLPVKGEGIFLDDFAKLCSAAKIVIGINDNNEIENYFSDRTFQVPACRGFHLTSRVPGMENWFGDGEHLACFDIGRGLGKKKYADAVEKVIYWLERPEERGRIAEAGQKWVYERYTWQKLCAQWIEKISELISDSPKKA
ncbi:MAG: CgeB family protein [Planctomycetota bacterium]|jgi:spore maturation protein CgeB